MGEGRGSEWGTVSGGICTVYIVAVDKQAVSLAGRRRLPGRAKMKGLKSMRSIDWTGSGRGQGDTEPLRENGPKRKNTK